MLLQRLATRKKTRANRLNGKPGKHALGGAVAAYRSMALGVFHARNIVHINTNALLSIGASKCLSLRKSKKVTYR